MAKSETAAERGARALKDAGYKKRGGRVKGGVSMDRPDRRARGGGISDDQPDDADGNINVMSKRADGGSVGKKGAKTIININAAGDPQGDQQRVQMAHQAGIQQGAQAAAQKLGGGGPPGMPPGGAPMGGPPGPPMAGPPGMPPPGAAGPPGMPPRPMMPPPGGMPMHARGGALRDGKGRFSGGAV